MKIIVDHISYKYNIGTNQELIALNDINFVVNPGEFLAVIGHTGSGKSTLIQHLNGLLKPYQGTVYFDGEDIFDDDYDRKKLRGKVGLVFQYPEHQLFEENVFKDVCFGPKNLGWSKREVELKAFEALQTVKLETDVYYQSPFDLSGGQKRKVAIAGVLAMQPEVLILDEPTAGLDPLARQELLECIKSFQTKRGMAIVLVSHSMEDVANYADRVIVINKGCKVYDDIPENVFSNVTELERMGLKAPEIAYITTELAAKGFSVRPGITTLQEAEKEILNCFKSII